ncbi:MICOS complex subunit MIC27 isoform X3 [Alligator mississippiensis]|uniref:MICOS complex subunit n=1 Tax=Alligator mississippiensis TaxID=8496 RepID=A0A151NPN0_ALLMI|nr:MICOS complex subunit MIC27 isoform X3 [Alligator mississippiensis]KYO38445.1 MICOS complex subunit MIC27 isoform A [Alligator mississippiensis]
MAAKMAKLVAVPCALACTSISVYAATEEGSKTHPIKPNQLPIYCAPPLKSKYIEEQPGRLQMGFSTLRKTASRYVKWTTDAYVFVKNGIMDSVQFGKDTYVYLKNPPPEFLPKVGVITISGLSGIVLARKGSRFKKIVYPLGLATLGISVCYPAQSVKITKVTGKKVYSASHQTYETIQSLWTKSSSVKEEGTKLSSHLQVLEPLVEGGSKSAEGHKTTPESQVTVKLPPITEFAAMKTQSPQNATSVSAEIKIPNAVSDVVKTTKFKPDPRLMDHGQSKPEDVDMYSTRS